MKASPQQPKDTDVEPYVPPSVEVLGAIAEITSGTSGPVTDSCSTGEYTYSDKIVS